MSDQSKNILIRGVNWIGDAVLTLPAIHAVRQSFPDAHIALLVKPWVSDIFKENRDIDEIILYDKSHSGIIGRLKLARELRSRGFNKAILLQNAFDAAFITWIAGIPERVGYKRDKRGFLLTEAVDIRPEILEKHQVYYYLDLLKSIGIESAEPEPYMNLSRPERIWAKNHLSLTFNDLSTPLVGINPGAAFGSAKRWLPENFAALILHVLDELKGRVIIFGGHAEIEIAQEIVSEVSRRIPADKQEEYRERLTTMSGQTDLRQLAALIAECDVFVTNDSGPMHMAAALFVPVVAIFGSTSPVHTGPFGKVHRVVKKDLPCAPCMKRDCPEGHLKCMTEVSPEEVFSQVKAAMPSHSAVFLDKDGTMIEDKNYLNSFDDLHIMRGVKSGLKKLKGAGFKLICITNQSGIARGIVDRKFVLESNTYLEQQLSLDGSYYCPHHPDETCHCRKPEPLMLLKARNDHHINLRASYIIGDKESDVMLAPLTGSKGILLSSTPLFEDSCAHFIAKDLGEAVNWILEQERVNS